MQDWRKNSVRLKNAAKGLALKLISATGRLELEDEAALATRQADAVEYFGDVPDDGQGLRDREQRRLVFANPRPQEVVEDDILYSRHGMAWRSGTLIAAFSVRPPSLKEALDRPPKDVSRVMDEGFIVQSDFPYSYGDWLNTYFGTVLVAKPLAHPLVVPEFLARKGYVRRELDIANVKYVPADDWVRLRKAHILRKRIPILFWTKEYIDAFERSFSVERKPPRPNSLTYLGRFDLPGEVISRRYPSEEAAAAVESFGGQVVRQEVLNASTAPSFHEGMETIVADHGSGVLNILFWAPKTVIELVVDNWWTNNNLFVAKDMGVKNYAVLNVDGLGRDAIIAKLRACFDHFAAAESGAERQNPNRAQVV